MAEARLSVVVRSMGRRELADALASIADQDWPAIEVVVVNALGPGHPPVPAQAGAHPVRFVDSPTRRTRPQAANAGWDAATGDWVGFLDDDDLYLPAHASTLLRHAHAHPGARVVYGATRMVDRSGALAKVEWRPWGRVDIFQHVPCPLNAVVAARSLRDEGVRFDESFEVFEDWDFWLQAAERTPFLAVRDEVAVYRFELGRSGASEGGNRDARLIDDYLVRIAAKWKARGEQWVARYERVLADAQRSLHEGRLPEAERLFREAAALWAVKGEPVFGLGVARAMAGRLADAKRAFEHALRLAPDDPGCLCNLALTCERLGERDEARALGARLVARWPDYEPGRALLRRLS